ncbi:MAG: hypothetical protein ACPGXZ_00155 [Saprospiraceae bacterium]
MAKTYGVNIDINTNSKETQKEFDRLRKSIAEATDEVNDLSKQFGENSKEADAARKSLSELTLAYDGMTKEATDLGATFEDVYGEMKPLTGQMGEMEDRLYQMSLAGDTSSQAYKDLLAEVGNYRRVQIETDLAVDQAAETFTGKLGKGLEGATSGFAAVQGVMGLVGSESQQLEKTLLKVQSALAIQQGVKGMIDFARSTNLAGKAMKVFNAIVSLNPLTLIITAVVALIGYFAVFTDAIDVVIDGLKAVGDWLGITNFEEDKQAAEREERHQAELRRIEREKEARQNAFNARQNQYNREIALAEALGKSTRELREQQLQDSIEFNKKEGDNLEKSIKEQEDLVEGLRDNLDFFGQEILDNDIDKLNELKKAQADYYEASKDADNDLKIFKINNRDEDAADEAADQAERLANYKTYLQNRINAARKIEDQENQLLEEGIEKELEINRDKFRREREDIKRNENLKKDEKIRLTELSVQLEAQAEQKIRDKFAKQKQAEDERREKESFEALKAIKVTSGQETLNLLNEQLQAENAAVIAADKERQRIEQEAAERRKRNIELTIQATRDGLQILSDLTEIFANKSEKQQRQAFKVQKAINIANATIDTYQAANVALKSAPPPFNYVAVAAAITTGFLNIKKIASTKFEGGGTAPSETTPDAAGLEGGAITPEFNVVGDSGINQLAQLQQQPVQAFVVSGEVTTAQSLDRNRVQNATL